MVNSRDRSGLRQLLDVVVSRHLSGNTHATLNAAFAELAMPEIPKEEGSLRERIERSYAQVSDNDLPHVAQRILACGSLTAATRNGIQDLLWAESSPPAIPKRVRRELARALDLADMARHEARFMTLLERFWVLDREESLADLLLPSTNRPPGLRQHIQQHVFRNPEDWSTEDLFEHLGAFEAGDARFAHFLASAVSADVLLDEPAQRHLVAQINEQIRSAGVELRETGADGGYPRFTLVSTRLADNRRPKNVIFASLTKPDIRFLSAVDNDIEIVGDPGNVLVYDREITGDGIRWRDLQTWWQDTQKIADEAEAKKTLYHRLRRSLPGNSPGQRNVFELYHHILGSAVYDLPALLPEVWLHWDHKTVRERGPEALLRSRMDFLLLLPHGQRVVLEVDGSQHYTRDDGQVPDSYKYAELVAGDRELKLRGYEVFRFGHDELRDTERARLLLQEFLPALFQRFEVNGRTS
ncbi:AbiJ-related protein [Streptomyces sp. NPDC002514]|uniref:AbiJ-related protein n=1 Tax=Streptomyces sp. NPDC001270 TaxID=3364554 RepID=UPI0036755032